MSIHTLVLLVATWSASSGNMFPMVVKTSQQQELPVVVDQEASLKTAPTALNNPTTSFKTPGYVCEDILGKWKVAHSKRLAPKTAESPARSIIPDKRALRCNELGWPLIAELMKIGTSSADGADHSWQAIKNNPRQLGKTILVKHITFGNIDKYVIIDEAEHLSELLLLLKAPKSLYTSYDSPRMAALLPIGLCRHMNFPDSQNCSERKVKCCICSLVRR